MPFSVKNRTLHSAITAVTEPILDRVEDDQLRMIGAAIAFKGYCDVSEQVSNIVARDGYSDSNGFNVWRAQNSFNDLSMMKVLRSNLVAAGFEDDIVDKVAQKTTEVVSRDYSVSLGGR